MKLRQSCVLVFSVKMFVIWKFSIFLDLQSSQIVIGFSSSRILCVLGIDTKLFFHIGIFVYVSMLLINQTKIQIILVFTLCLALFKKNLGASMKELLYL